MKSRTRFHNALAAGYTRSQAARRAHIRSNTTAQRWHQDWLAQQAKARNDAAKAEKLAQEAQAQAIAQAKAQANRRRAEEEYRRSPEGIAAEASRKAKDVRCPECGNPPGFCHHASPAQRQEWQSEPAEVAAVPSNPRNLVQDPWNRSPEPGYWDSSAIRGRWTASQGFVSESDHRAIIERIRRQAEPCEF